VFAEYPHWQVSEKQAREVRTELYKVLLRPPAAGAADRGTGEPGPTYDVTNVVARPPRSWSRRKDDGDGAGAAAAAGAGGERAR
jgi:hypothetical protein